MGNVTYLTKLGQHTGYSVLPNARTFKTNYRRSKGIVLGLKDGYLVTVGLISSRNHKALNILVRYRVGSPKDAIETTLKGLPAFKGLAARKVKVSEDSLLVTWTYAFRRPSPDAVEKSIDEVITNIKGLALPFSGKCEECNSSDAGEVTLVNGVPGYHCEGCRSRTIAEKEREAEEYRNRPANYVVGVPVATLVAVITGTAWGLIISAMEAGSKTWTPKLHAIVGLVIGGAVSWTFFKVLGKVNRAGQAIAIVLTLLGKFWGDTLFYTFSLLIARDVNISTNPLSWSPTDFRVFMAHLHFVLPRFWEFKLDDYGKVVLFGDLFCAGSVAWMPWAKVPKFIPNYESAGKIEESAKHESAKVEPLGVTAKSSSLT